LAIALVLRPVANVLIDVSPTDLATLATVAVVLLLVAVNASYIPARRAANVDPLVALRCE
jgi:putative ABC transport system permease protein